MEHAVLERVLVWVVLAVGLMGLAKFLLSEGGDFYRWLKDWWRLL
jgi:hypothetical protein